MRFPTYSLKCTAEPAEEPLTLDEAKEHLRVLDAYQDNKIARLIKAARRRVQTETRRTLITSTWRMMLNDGFPPYRTDDGCTGRGLEGLVLHLPVPPLQTVSSITYRDENNESQTLAADRYVVNAEYEPGRVRPAYGYSWPATAPVDASVTVTFVAGYGLASAVPETVKEAMLLIIGHLYEHREEVPESGVSSSPLPKGVAGLLADVDWGSAY